MKRTWTQAIVMAAVLTACGTAFAEEGMYVGGALSRVDYKEDGIPTFNPTTLAVVLGKSFNPNFAAEIRLGTGLSSDSKTVFGIPVDVEVSHYMGIYGKGIVPLSNVVSVYGLLGFTKGKLEYTAPAIGLSDTESDSSVSYGLGADFALSQTTSIGIEWASLVQGDGYDLNALSLTARFKF